MKFFSTMLALLPVAAMAFPAAAKDNSKAVEAGLAQIKNDTIQINNTLNTIKPTDTTIPFGTLITLLTESQQTVTDLNKTTAAANSSSNFNGADAIVIAASNIDLSNTVQSLLSNFQNKAPAFKAQGVAPIVADQLVQQRELTREFANGLAPKLGVLSGFAPIISNQLLQKFDQTIAVYRAT